MHFEKTNLKAVRLVLPLFGLLLFIGILYGVDLKSVVNALVRINPLKMAVAILLLAATIPVRALRLLALLRKLHKVEPRFTDLLLLGSYANFTGTFTPGRLGEFVKLAYFQNSLQLRTRSGVTVLVVDRLCDVTALLFFGVLGAMSFYSLSLTMHLLAFLTMVISLIGVAFFSQHLAWVNLLWTTTLSSLLVYSANYIIIRALGHDLSLFDSIAVSAVSSLASLLPISFLGVGTRDGALILMLESRDITPESAIVVSLCFLGAVLVLGVLSGLTTFNGRLQQLLVVRKN